MRELSVPPFTVTGEPDGRLLPWADGARRGSKVAAVQDLHGGRRNYAIAVITASS